MIKKTIKYTNFNGVETESTHYFHISRVEAAEMEYSVDGGYTNFLQRISEEKNPKELMKMFKEFICASYGKKTPDGEGFTKTDPITGRPLYEQFRETAAFEALYIELATNAKAAAEFVENVLPNVDEFEKMVASEIPDNVVSIQS